MIDNRFATIFTILCIIAVIFIAAFAVALFGTVVIGLIFYTLNAFFWTSIVLTILRNTFEKNTIKYLMFILLTIAAISFPKIYNATNPFYWILKLIPFTKNIDYTSVSNISFAERTVNLIICAALTALGVVFAASSKKTKAEIEEDNRKQQEKIKKVDDIKLTVQKGLDNEEGFLFSVVLYNYAENLIGKFKLNDSENYPEKEKAANIALENNAKRGYFVVRLHPGETLPISETTANYLESMAGLCGQRNITINTAYITENNDMSTIYDCAQRKYIVINNKLAE